MSLKLQSRAWSLAFISVCIVVLTGCSNPPNTYRTIHEAVINGDYPAVKADLQAKPGDLELPDGSGQTPLHLAAIHCRTNIITLLLDRGALVDSRMTGGATPLHLAAQSGCIAGMSILLSHQARIDALDDQKRTPLVRAEQWHQDAAAQYLRDYLNSHKNSAPHE